MAEGAPETQDVQSLWERMERGLKAKAMREVYENQEKLVTELQREQMALNQEVAMAIVRARAYEELQQLDRSEKLRTEEIAPRLARLSELSDEIDGANGLLQAFQTIGRGII